MTPALEKEYIITDSDRNYILSHPEDMRTIYGIMERARPYTSASSDVLEGKTRLVCKYWECTLAGHCGEYCARHDRNGGRCDTGCLSYQWCGCCHRRIPTCPDEKLQEKKEHEELRQQTKEREN